MVALLRDGSASNVASGAAMAAAAGLVVVVGLVGAESGRRAPGAAAAKPGKSNMYSTPKSNK